MSSASGVSHIVESGVASMAVETSRRLIGESCRKAFGEPWIADILDSLFTVVEPPRGTIAGFAINLGCSPRTLRRASARAFGSRATLKRLIRIAWLEHAIVRRARSPHLSWSDIAGQCRLSLRTLQRTAREELSEGGFGEGLLGLATASFSLERTLERLLGVPIGWS